MFGKGKKGIKNEKCWRERVKENNNKTKQKSHQSFARCPSLKEKLQRKKKRRK